MDAKSLSEQVVTLDLNRLFSLPYFTRMTKCTEFVNMVQCVGAEGAV